MEIDIFKRDATSLKSYVVPAKSVADAIEELVDSSFAAAVEVETELYSDKSVVISPEYLAIFLRQMFTLICPKAFLHIKISENDDGLVLTFWPKSEITVPTENFADAVRTARNARMEIQLSKKAIVATVNFVKTKHYHVYANDLISGKQLIMARINEIFFDPEE